MFRQTGNSAAPASRSGETLVTQTGGGSTSDVNLTEVGGAAIALGQTTMAASLPVVVASNQTAIPISGSVTTGGLTDTQLRATPVPVSGTVTANAGTNLNTSALALEAGHLATIDTSTAATAAVDGTTAGAAVITDANGTIQQYLRGLVKLAITAGGFLVTATIAAGTAIIGSIKFAGFQNAMWYVHHIPAANTQATITQSSAGGSTKNVCTGFQVTLCGQSSAPAAVQLSVSLIDGATGGGTYLWRSVISLPASAGAISAFIKTGAWFVGTAATAMTLEFSAAGGANTIESVSMSGTTTL